MAKLGRLQWEDVDSQIDEEAHDLMRTFRTIKSREWPLAQQLRDLENHSPGKGTMHWDIDRLSSEVESDGQEAESGEEDVDEDNGSYNEDVEDDTQQGNGAEEDLYKDRGPYQSGYSRRS